MCLCEKCTYAGQKVLAKYEKYELDNNYMNIIITNATIKEAINNHE